MVSQRLKEPCWFHHFAIPGSRGMRRTNLNEIVGSPSNVAVHPFKFSGFPKTVYTPSFYGIERFFRWHLASFLPHDSSHNAYASLRHVKVWREGRTRRLCIRDKVKQIYRLVRRRRETNLKVQRHREQRGKREEERKLWWWVLFEDNTGWWNNARGMIGGRPRGSILKDQ